MGIADWNYFQVLNDKAVVEITLICPFIGLVNDVFFWIVVLSKNLVCTWHNVYNTILNCQMTADQCQILIVNLQLLL